MGTSDDGGGRRVLLVELLSTERFSQYRSELYPFVQGWVRARGMDAAWHVFGFDPAAQPGGRYRVTLPDGERGRLVELARAFAATHVLFNEEPDAATEAAVRAALPAGARVDVHMLRGGPELATVGRLVDWLGLATETPGRALVDDAAPDYGCSLENELARTSAPFVFVEGGPTCVYGAPLGRNPHFAGLADTLAAEGTRVGCSFCGVTQDRRYPFETPPVELALGQIRRAFATCPAPRRAGGFLVSGASHFHRLRAVLDGVLADGLPAATFWFACRIDELLRRAGDIEALLPRLRAAGHVLVIGNMGVENFSPVENERFNKGIGADDVAAVLAVVERFERDFPGTFRFSDAGGFGYILFTPWTTTDDLRVNLEQAARVGVEPGSFFFASRVQLLPDRALTRLAERDGLLAETFDEATIAAFDSGCVVSAEQEERPWRFRVPVIAPVYAVASHLRQRHMGGHESASSASASSASSASPPAPPEPGEGDEAGRRLDALLTRLPEAWADPYRLLPVVLDAADEAPAERSVTALLDRAEARLAAALAVERARRVEAAAAAERPPELRAADEERARWERWTREVLRLLETHPKGLLGGFAARSVTSRETGQGWGELLVVLARGVEELRLFVVPRAAMPRAFRCTESLAVSHADETPADTPEKQRVIDVVARAVERYAAARRRDG